ncbi:CAP domain-containing protein [Leeuwenhoekiella aequorea]|uniref:CAP domain-containing protein n=1 Tax=Leeuwenhoekiella aequorea TaxID=283736 RepID=UPI00352C6367|tara:strand:+ start:33685 stop:34149 length:465 start_codon:yes stop_codon:yes gene_type:complete
MSILKKIFPCLYKSKGSLQLSDYILDYYNQPLTNELFALINAHRVSIGAKPLEVFNAAKIEAYNHSVYMLDTGEVSHDNFFNRSDNLKDKGALRVAENAAYGFKGQGAKEILNTLLNSEKHRIKLEGPQFTHTGLSVATKNNIHSITQILNTLK